MEETLEPIFEGPNPCAGTRAYIFEANIFFFKTLELWKRADEIDATVIRIYDLTRLDGAEGTPMNESLSGG